MVGRGFRRFFGRRFWGFCSGFRSAGWFGFSRRRSSVACFHRQLNVSQADGIAIVEKGLGDFLAVNKASVGRAEIAQPVRPGLKYQLGMMARDQTVREPQLAVQVPPDHDAWIAQVKMCAVIRPGDDTKSRHMISPPQVIPSVSLCSRRPVLQTTVPIAWRSEKLKSVAPGGEVAGGGLTGAVAYRTQARMKITRAIRMTSGSHPPQRWRFALPGLPPNSRATNSS